MDKKGEKNQAKVPSGLCYATSEMLAEESVAKQILSEFGKDGEGALFTAGDTGKKHCFSRRLPSIFSYTFRKYVIGC